MIVDDDGLVENMIEKQLREAGYEEHSFDDPGSALSYFATERDRVALVALPVMMPGLTGDGMVREMRQQAPDVGIILLSGLSNDCNPAKSSITMWLKP